MNDRLRILVVDMKSSQILKDLKQIQVFSVTEGNLRTVELKMKPDVIIVNYEKIFNSFSMQKKLLNLIYRYALKPLVIAYKDNWDELIKEQAKLFGVDRTISKDDIGQFSDFPSSFILETLTTIKKDSCACKAVLNN